MKQKRPLFYLLLATLFIAIVISSCAGSDDATTESVEVTRVVTEEVVVEGETVEVTVFVEAEEVMEEEFEEAVEEEMAEEAMDEEAETVEETDDSDFQAVDSEGSIGDVPPTPESGPKVEGTRATPVVATSEPSNPDVRAPDDTSNPQNDNNNETVANDSRLNAGAIDDNVDFDTYLAYLDKYQGEMILALDVRSRHKLLVTDDFGNPINGASIQIIENDEVVTELTTHSDGAALFFPNAYASTADSYTVIINYKDQTISQLFSPTTTQTETHFSFDESVPEMAVQLDILILLDSTGSMSDELTQLKENIRFISTEIESLSIQTDVQFGMVTYRDRGEAYITNQTPFTNDIEQFANALDQVEAAGGGDYPEDIHTALDVSLNAFQWRQENQISLIFLIADAPPHLDYDQSYDYLDAIEQANQLGIKFYPIASSGLDEQGEYIFRQLAQTTNGRFIFLTDDPTNDNEESSNSTIDSETAYTVTALDDLIIEIITEELSHQIDQ